MTHKAYTFTLSEVYSLRLYQYIIFSSQLQYYSAHVAVTGPLMQALNGYSERRKTIFKT